MESSQQEKQDHHSQEDGKEAELPKEEVEQIDTSTHPQKPQAGEEQEGAENNQEDQNQVNEQQEESSAQIKQRKNRELSYMKPSNIIGGQDQLGKQRTSMGSFMKNQQNKMFNFFSKQKQDRALDFKQMRKNLDAQRIPAEIEYMFPNKVRVYEQMREMEESMNSFIKQKLLNVKEDLLQNNAKVKRNVRIMAEITSSQATEWKLRVEGRLMENETEEGILRSSASKRFLHFFEKIRIEFPNDEYPTVEWVKAKSDTGSAFDALEITRAYTKEQKRKQSPIKVKLSFYVENNPKKYRLSPQLAKILGIDEESRLRVVGALWQYIKSNRLQDSDNRELINCNSELLEIFGEEKMEFHNAVFRLKDHLYDVQPIELTFEILPRKQGHPLQLFYDLPVFEYANTQREQLEFLINCNYDFFNQNPDQQDQQMQSTTSKLALNGNILKKREQKYNMKISNSIDKLKRSYRHMTFFNRLSQDVKTHIQNVIIEQNKWLKVIQEEQHPFYETTGEHEQAAFYQQNQNWIMGEVENYLKHNQMPEKEEEEDEEKMSDEEEEEVVNNEKSREKANVAVHQRSGAYNLRH